MKRTDAVKMARTTDQRVRVIQAIGAGLAAGGSQTTATGTATYSDETTVNYTVRLPDPQAQSDAINRAQRQPTLPDGTICAMNVT